MIPKEVFQNIRRIQIRSSRKVDELLAGSWHSAFKGRGVEFEEVRPYQVGDDVRSIDWNVTARCNEPFVKLFREEREMSVMLLVDVSGSQHFGSQSQTKREVVVELGATLAMSAIKNNDKVGLTLFTDQIETSLPPRKGSRHVLRLIRELIYFQPRGRKTQIQQAIDHLNRTSKRRSVVFLVSDFQDQGFETALKVAVRKHDIIPIVITDPREIEMPNVGIIRLQDQETGETVALDTSSRRNRRLYQELSHRQRQNRNSLFQRLKIAPIELSTHQDIVDPLRQYFHFREARK